MPMVETERLILREWKDQDLKPFAQMNADPRVMEYFPKTLNFRQTRKLYQKIRDVGKKEGFCVQPVVEKSTDQFVGFAGLFPVQFDAPFTPATEIGWRLAHDYWGKGYASEAAFAWLDYGFGERQLEKIVSFTTQTNQRSRRVMERIGMRHNFEHDFDHPGLDARHELARHVLYELTKNDYLLLSGTAD